jgi:hypothetical protein
MKSDFRIQGKFRALIPLSFLLIVCTSSRGEGGASGTFEEWLKRDRADLKSWQDGGRHADEKQVKPSREQTAGLEVIEDDGEFLTIPPTWAIAGVDYHYAPQLATQSVDSVFRLVQSPATMQISTNTGAISWAPLSGDVGSAPVELIAESSTATNRQAFTISVTRFVEVASGVITTNGGTITGGNCTLTAPVGVVGQDVDIALRTIELAPTSTAMAGVQPVGDIYSISTRGGGETNLSGIRAALRYDASALPAGVTPADLKVFSFDPAHPERVKILDKERGDARFLAEVAVGIPAALVGYGVYIGYQFCDTTIPYTHSEVTVYFRTAEGTNTAAMAANRAYAVKIVSTVTNAKAKAISFGCDVPDHMNVMVGRFPLLTSDAMYRFEVGSIYVKPKLASAALLKTVTHEYFHAIQDIYYNMLLAAANTAGASASDVYWWNEASAVWFSAHVFPERSKEIIGDAVGAGTGYLYDPLNGKRQTTAYARSSFLEYSVKEMGAKFISYVLKRSSGMTSVMSALDAKYPLNKHYKGYVNWALETYGETSSFGDSLFLEKELEEMNYSKISVQSQASVGRPIHIVPVGSESNVVQEVFRDGAITPYMAFIHKIGTRKSLAGVHGKVIDVKFERSEGAPGDMPFVLLDTADKDAPFDKQALPIGARYTRLPRIGLSASDHYREAWFVYTDTTSGSPSTETSISGQTYSTFATGGQYTWTVQVRDLDPLAGPWTSGLELPELGYDVMPSPDQKVQSTKAGIRLVELKINGTYCTTFTQFDAWAKQWLRNEFSEPKEEEDALASALTPVSSGMDAAMDAIGVEMILNAVPAAKILYEGVPFALATELIGSDRYLPFIPGMTDEQLQEIRTNKKLAALQSKDGTSLSGVWDLSRDGDAGSSTLEWHIELAEDTEVMEYSLKYLGSGLSPDDDSKNAIHSLEVLAEGELRYQNLPHGEIAHDQDFADSLKVLFMMKLMTEKVKTDATYKPLVASLKAQQSQHQPEQPPQQSSTQNQEQSSSPPQVPVHTDQQLQEAQQELDETVEDMEAYDTVPGPQN